MMKFVVVALGFLASESIALALPNGASAPPPTALLDLGYATYEGTYNAAYEVGLQVCNAL